MNLLASPDAEVQIGRHRHKVRARLAGGDERNALWTKMNAHYHGFDDYRARTEREIKIFVLEPS